MSRSQIDQIKESLDIMQVAREYISDFKKRGVNYFALCPFHHEKTPSFSINPEMGIFKCFGCGESGDVLTFIQKMEGVEFPKALEIAAKKAGVELKKQFSQKDEQAYRQKQKIYKLNSLVAEYYHYILTEHAKGEKGREYAQKRKIDKTLIEKFKLGYAPKSYSNLLNFLTKKGYEKRNLVQWGLIVNRKNSFYDKFRDRLIFPLINHHGDIEGFSGRIVSKNTKAPKYLHSPQTPVFNKSEFVFGLYEGKGEIRKKDFAVFCEGQLDVISSHKTKIQNVVASLGTALTKEQIQLVKRYSENIYFCFDNDLAGEKALLRASKIALSNGVSTKAVTLPEGQDADELIKTSKEKWKKVVKNAEPVVDHMIRRLNKRLDLSNTSDKEEFATIILPLIASAKGKIEKSDFVHKASIALNIDEEILAEEIKNFTSEREDQSVSRKKLKKVINSPVSSKEQYLIALVFQHVDFLKISLKHIRLKHFSSPFSKQLIRDLKNYSKEKKRFTIKNFLTSLEEDQKKFVKNILLQELNTYYDLEKEFEKELIKTTRLLEEHYLRRQIRNVKNQLEKAEKDSDKDKIDELLDKLRKYSKELKTIVKKD